MPRSLTFLGSVALSSGQLLIWQKQQTDETEVTALMREGPARGGVAAFPRGVHSFAWT